MRWDAIAALTGGWESDSRRAPDGGAGAATLPPEDDPASAARATPRTATQLPQRRTTLLIEDVDVRHVDRDRDVVVELHADRVTRRELRHEVRARGGDALGTFLFLRLFVGEGSVDAHDLRVDLQVRDGLRSERLQQFEACGQRRQVGPVRRRIEILRPDPEDDRLPRGGAYARVVRQRLVGEQKRLRTDRHGDAAVLRLDLRLDQVHRGRADEAGDEEVGRRVVQPLRDVHLLQLAAAHDRDAVAHRHRLDLVVRDVDRRRLELVLQARDVGAHLDAQLGIEVRERLVHQERLRLADDRPAHRDALTLPAGELLRP